MIPEEIRVDRIGKGKTCLYSCLSLEEIMQMMFGVMDADSVLGGQG